MEVYSCMCILETLILVLFVIVESHVVEILHLTQTETSMSQLVCWLIPGFILIIDKSELFELFVIA